MCLRTLETDNKVILLRFYMKNRHLSKFILPIFSILILSGCSQTIEGMVDDVNKGVELGRAEARGHKGSERFLASPCPQIEIVDDLGMIYDFVSDNNQSKQNLIANVKISNGGSECELATNSAIVDLTLEFNGELGPKARQRKSDKPFLTYPFFVAVTGPNGKIMAKEVFAMSMSFDPGQNKRRHEENLRQIIPIKGKELAFKYRVYVGFQLTPEQLAYNRSILKPVNVPIPKRKPRIIYTEDTVVEIQQ